MDEGYEESLLTFIDQLPRLTNIDAKIILADFYESRTGIYNHLVVNKHRPLASVAFHPAEEYTQGSLLEEMIRSYTASRINDLFGLSLTEFLDLPADIVELLMAIASEDQNKKLSAVNAVEQQMKKEGLG